MPYLYLTVPCDCYSCILGMDGWLLLRLHRLFYADIVRRPSTHLLALFTLFYHSDYYDRIGIVIDYDLFFPSVQ